MAIYSKDFKLNENEETDKVQKINSAHDHNKDHTIFIDPKHFKREMAKKG